jgi:hypothetical protein
MKIVRIQHADSLKVALFSTASHFHCAQNPNDLGNESIIGGGKWAGNVGQHD